MSMTTELIDRLMKYAQILEDTSTKEDISNMMCMKTMREAAVTIEELSAKLHTSQMERSSQYYHGGWVPVDEQLPENFIKVMVTLKNGAVMEMLYRMGEFAFVGWSELVPTSNENPVIAWRPLPEPYSPNNQEVEDANND